MKSLQFHNWTNEEFVWTWAGDEYVFPAGSTMYLQEYLAMHFAKHLATREMFKAGLELNVYKHPQFQKNIDKCLLAGESVVEAKSEARIEAEVMNINAEANSEIGHEVGETKRRGRPPKKIVEEAEKSEEVI